MKKQITIDFICYAIILLFIYAAFAKLTRFDIYISDLQRSPYIGEFSSVLSITLPFTELAIAILLFFEKSRLKGLWAATILMTIFSIYVGLMIGILDSRPCTCGGLIRDLTWRQHFALNLFYTALAAIGTAMQTTKQHSIKRIITQ